MVSELRRNNTPVGGGGDLNLDLSGSNVIGQRIIQRMRRLANASHDFSGFTFSERLAGCISAEVSDFEMICDDYYRHDDQCYYEVLDEEREYNSALESSSNDYYGQGSFESVSAEEEYDSDAVRSDYEYDGDRLLLPGLDDLRRSLGDNPLSGVLEAVSQSESFGAADVRALAILLGDSRSVPIQRESASGERVLEGNESNDVRRADKQTFIPREGNEMGKYIR